LILILVLLFILTASFFFLNFEKLGREPKFQVLDEFKNKLLLLNIKRFTIVYILGSIYRNEPSNKILTLHFPTPEIDSGRKLPLLLGLLCIVG
jgi:hypothetical protein